MQELLEKEKPTAVAEPRLMGAYDRKGRGRWYAGNAPKKTGELPVLVFVPGLGESARCFYGKNDLYGNNELYARALADGFRTAFVSFMGDHDKPFDMWTNGEMLAWQLKQICAYYRVKDVVVVAHSKGGIDAQAAAFFGAAGMIRKTVTLSSPHWGSQLADLAYSSIAWPLAEYLGQHSEGCFCMQTGYMRAFRRMVDADSSGRIKIETLAGNGTTPPLSSVWAGAQFMSRYGENDGVVTVKNAQNPFGRHLATLPLNHVEMMLGQTVWQYLKPAVLGLQLPVVPVNAKKEQSCGLIYRGGGLEKGMDESFPVDSSISGMDMLIFQSGDVPCQIIDPGGTARSDFGSSKIGEARLLRLTVPSPRAGRWRLTSKPGEGAFFAVIRFTGTFCVFPEEKGKKAGGVGTFLRVLRTFADHEEVAAERQVGQFDIASPLRLPEGSYTLESAVRGVLEDGSEFERNLLRPVMIGEPVFQKKNRTRSV